MRITKSITLSEFIELWENVRKGKYNKIAPSLGEKLASIWRETVLEQFENLKKNMSWGDQTEIMQNLRQYVQFITTSGIPSLPKKSYTNEEYAKRYPFTYVESTELKQKMEQPSQYKIKGFDKTGKLTIRVNIPKREGRGSPEAYQWLEAKRSLVTASFVIAWPKMLKAIMESIG